MTHHGSYFHLQPAKNFAMIIEAERDHEPRVIWPDISFLPNVISFKVQSDVIDFVRLDTRRQLPSAPTATVSAYWPLRACKPRTSPPRWPTIRCM